MKAPVHPYLLAAAVQRAAEGHSGQLDKNGRPYILHPLRIMLRMADVEPDDEEAQVVAVMHDLIEDTNITLESLRGWYSTRVIDALDAISQRKGKETYKEYIQRCRQNSLAVLVKIEDVRDNLNPGSSFEGGEGLRKRYFWALRELRNA